MSDQIDVTFTPTASGYAVSVDAILGLEPVTAERATAAEAADAAVVATVEAATLFAESEGEPLPPASAMALDARVRAAVSGALYALENPAPSPPPAVGYGLDVSTFPDLDPSLAVQTGQRMVGEAVARRLLTRRGLLPYAPGDGLDVRDLVSQGFSQAGLGALRAQIEDEASKDERVVSAQARIAFDQGTRTLSVRVSVQTDVGPFLLVLTIGDLATDVRILTR